MTHVSVVSSLCLCGGRVITQSRSRRRRREYRPSDCAHRGVLLVLGRGLCASSKSVERTARQHPGLHTRRLHLSSHQGRSCVRKLHRRLRMGFITWLNKGSHSEIRIDESMFQLRPARGFLLASVGVVCTAGARVEQKYGREVFSRLINVT